MDDSSRPRRGAIMGVIAVVGALLVALAGFSGGAAAAPAAGCKVLILGESVSGSPSLEEQEATAKGCTVEVVTDAEWQAKSTADFATYQALIIGDPTCQGTNSFDGAIPNAATWAAAVTGNVVINGTDPVFHRFSGGETLTRRSVDFAVDEAGKTGAYISLTCAYDSASAEPVSLLSGFGSFTVSSASCYNDAHITASHPALAGLTDADLSNWFCSVHEQFDSWPSSFLVLAIAENSGSAYTAPDGTSGTPYILARGKDLAVISDITLTQATDTNTVGTPHTVTATVKQDGTPISGRTVNFSIVSGPGTPASGTGTTNASGQTTFTFNSATAGDTVVQATFVDSAGRTQTSNQLTKHWVDGPPSTDTCDGKAATIVGTNAAETINGTAGNDVIVAKGGKDTIYGLGGNDTICAGDKDAGTLSGNDTVWGGAGDDTLLGEGGNDTLNGEGGNDMLKGGDGMDMLLGGAGNDSLSGGTLSDKLGGGAGDDSLSGDEGSDLCDGGSGSNVISPTCES